MEARRHRCRTGRRRRGLKLARLTTPARPPAGWSRSAGSSGYGPIPAELGRELAANATSRRLLTDPAGGEVLDLGTTRYRPTASLVERIVARDGTCRAVKLLPGWRVELHRDGTMIWHTPHGKTYRTSPGGYIPRRN